MKTVSEMFGTMVFNDEVMKERLPEEVYKSLQNTIQNGKHLDLSLANVVANAMKDWAIEKGATHYTHWFQPMTGITAEKHDSFISPKDNSTVIMEFKGKELVRGEPDASSFPSGGLRATFEARGYTAWDPTSYAFIKGKTLCIPTAFCSYGGEALDKKTPLLRSMEVLGKAAIKIVHLFGNEDVTQVRTTVGPEQEYFLIDKDLFYKRPDLVYTGRTLFGAMPPKGQELDDHYFGSIKPRVKAFMLELDEELWKLGVFAKTEHNEVAPSQHELAPIFTTTNLATDHNQLTMELMQRVAKKHGFVCLLHEKPFDGVNGSGKHNNWSLSTNTGVNLLEPGETPSENAQFLLFLCAVIKAVDEYQDLLRISVASAGNDHRLGANEAPPAVVSMFLGDELSAVLDALERDEKYTGREKEQMRVGVHILPKFPKDTTDRNRTSPFAFTGNKFEFRMLGSSASIADTNTVINTAVTQVLNEFYEILSVAQDFNSALHNLIRETIKQHKRILFNGNGYDDKWIEEAEKRGLSNLKSTPEAIERLLDAKNVQLFVQNKVFSEKELKARFDIMLENYSKVINIEALTMIDMAKKSIIPAVSKYTKELVKTATMKNNLGIDSVYETKVATKLSSLNTEAYELTLRLENEVYDANLEKNVVENARKHEERVLSTMKALRMVVDEMETMTSKEYWPMPNYSELLFGVK
ncbi:MAG: glutamine synthetase type III [Ruminococcaceae bacterium]|nr:glutamine synthetase type III [Oscillospiraceae bacterium]